MMGISRSLGFTRSASLAVALLLVLSFCGCDANDPFDPESVTNARPTARIFAAPVDSGAGIQPTSYLGRRFSWSGSDRDGWIVEYHVSIRTEANTPAPWDTTARTDTTMSFVTDDQGQAEAIVLVACRDDRGAMSDTVRQFFPIRNFPPVIRFARDFDPLSNLQRDVTDNGAAADTVFWNWGMSNFRMIAYDPDDIYLPSGSTMDPFYRYTLADGDPDVTWDLGDPEADPEIGWIRVPFGGTLAKTIDVRSLAISLRGVSPGQRTLTVSVGDNADADGRFQYSWEVRAPRGPLLLVADNTSSLSREFFTELLDTHLGAGNWDIYAFPYGFPDDPANFLETTRLFTAVVWPSGSVVSTPLAKATSGDARSPSLLHRYVDGGGRLLHVSVGLAGTTSQLPRYYIANVLGISADLAPPAVLKNFADLQALGQQSWLPPMTSSSDFGTATGLAPLGGTEVLYRMEECCVRGCYGTTNRPPVPCDPVVIVRRPERGVAPFASVISAGLQPEYFLRDEAVAAFAAMLGEELGVGTP